MPTDDPTPISWRRARFDDLSPRELYAILAARSEVFVVEQSCVFQDCDGRDFAAWHLSGWIGGELAALCRLFPPGAHYDEASVGRVLTRPKFRGLKLGRALMTEALRHCDELFPGAPNRIAAQAYLEDFYRSFGYETVSDPFDDDGIPHIYMLRSGVLAPASPV